MHISISPMGVYDLTVGKSTGLPWARLTVPLHCASL